MGIKKNRRRNNQPTHDAAVVTFSFPPDAKLADVIVDAWLNKPAPYTKPDGTVIQVPFGDTVLERNPKGNPTKKALQVATTRIRALGVDLKSAVIISEDEHDNDYYLDADEVVFVLPDPDRLDPAPSSTSSPQRLTDTAKLLMACTPNGI